MTRTRLVPPVPNVGMLREASLRADASGVLATQAGSRTVLAGRDAVTAFLAECGLTRALHAWTIALLALSMCAYLWAADTQLTQLVAMFPVLASRSAMMMAALVGSAVATVILLRAEAAAHTPRLDKEAKVEELLRRDYFPLQSPVVSNKVPALTWSNIEQHRDTTTPLPSPSPLPTPRQRATTPQLTRTGSEGTLTSSSDSAPASPVRPAPNERATVLVIDDTPINAKVAVRMLGLMGLKADVAENGLEGVRYVERYLEARRAAGAESDPALFPPLFILCDLMMPVLDGHQAAERIRHLCAQAGAEAPYIVAVTADVSDTTRKLCLLTHFDDFLEKPMFLATLRAAWGKFLQT